jgi:AraC-like DNA-binding protein
MEKSHKAKPSMKSDSFRHKIKRKYTSGPPGNVLDAEYFYFDTAPDYKKDLAIVCGGYEKCAPDFHLNRSNYPYYFIKYTLKGKGTLEIDSGCVELRPGILSGVPPKVPHIYKTNNESPMEHIFITFVGEECPDLFEKSSLSTKHFLEVHNADESLSLLQKILHIGQEKPEYAHDICRSYLRILLLDQASSLIRSKVHVPLSKATFLDCKKHIDTHFSTIKSPGQAAEKCGIDVRYMSGLFKRYSHLTPGQYLARLKLNKAAILLLTTDLGVKEVGYQVGFDDPYHFSKNFKKYYNCSPHRYRTEHG